MSTILKSLRKLEEEKKSHDKKLNLKEMMIREDARPPVRNEVAGDSRNWWTGLGLLLAGFAVAGFMAFLLWPKEKSRDNPQVSKPNPAQALTTPDEPSSPLGGVPLSSIPDFTQRPPREDEGVIEEFFIEEEPPPAIDEPFDIESNEPVMENVIPPVTETIEKPEPVVNAEPEANDEIVTALEKVPTQTRTTMEPTPSIPEIIPLESGESIEGLKLKGIIFYGEDNPENYLLFSYPGMSIHRLQVGQSIAEAKLVEIHPGLAVFEYEGRQIKLKVGS
ncbi:MAG: hypothetical protein G3M70_04970 [Candidatus Nitronauta litoralis]|uniref:Uncharacterized protein n=1 Tax=Candidatus Nitronauta litoralis TaxID=2705533 RepID=A0A7T0BUQ8_9BACT|nr:MAG: hypothetical protein G3M70_04970 [Candidatus Nitronauta litoralis]